MLKKYFRFVLSAVAIVVVAFAANAQAATITLTASDGYDESSFNSAVHWSNAAAPQSGNDYVVAAGLVMRTPPTTGNFTFAGDSLALGDGSNFGQFNFKGTTSGAVITVDDLRLNDGRIYQVAQSTVPPLMPFIPQVLAGNISLETGGGWLWSHRVDAKLTISANIGGVGGLTIMTGESAPLSTNGVVFTGTNSYQGGTTIATYARLDVQKDYGLGTGNVTLSANSSLVLGLGDTNNYIDDLASLILANDTDTAVELNYDGIDTIGALSFDGGATWAAVGTWGAPDSGADHTSDRFSGTGYLQIVPEPSALTLLAAGLVGLLAYAWRRWR
ncbi:MAG: PEP-CTERM sorting domain-containing protein [Pirellulaceae bacterium]|nr:PEP-CTERM sorting domain-containing protein [Pirellulaceae bacterium]